MLKKTLLALAASSMVALARLWMLDECSYRNFIAGVNNYQEHHDENVTQAQFENSSSTYLAIPYRNGMAASLPITVFVCVSPNIDVTASGFSTALQYRVRRNGTWVTGWLTVKTITNPNYTIEKSKRIPIFGTSTIHPKNIQNNDEIYIRWYITNGIWESGDLSENLDNIVVNNTEYADNYGSGYGSWNPSCIMKVVYNNTKRIGHGP